MQFKKGGGITKDFKLLMEKTGVNTKELAELLNVSPQAVGKWMRGEGLPRSEKLPALADALGCTIDFLFGRDTASA
ncbi:helix-turn-helix domain-containing protein [Oscillibacter sp.]|uniref:helix-turn-helix domain-containing protein n=1 Tax=Oscillibacter sp. TaxID=1945593 RepID=UPI0033908819